MPWRIHSGHPIGRDGRSGDPVGWATGPRGKVPARHPYPWAMVHDRTAPDDAPVFRRTLTSLLVLAALLGCATPTGDAGSAAPPPPAPSGTAATAAGSATFAAPPPPAPGRARLEPADGTAYLGLNLDWGQATAAEAATALGRTPAVWVQFARFPLDEGAVTNLDAFVQQVASVRGMGLITLEPHDGLDAVTAEAAVDLATLLAGYWSDHGVATFVRFAHEMNGSWYPWSQQPDAYIDAYRRVAAAVHAGAPASAMVWAPNQGSGYPFRGGAFGAAPGSADALALDTDGDGALTPADDPYAPYYPGDDAVDWVGMSLYHWGLEYPWGENELPRPGTFDAMLRGVDTGAHGEAATVPDFHAAYAEARDKPLAIVETAALYDPDATSGPTEADLKRAWFEQVFSASTRRDFPRIGMLSWFEWRKEEPEVGRVIDWRLGADPALARELFDAVPAGWLGLGGP
jgi:hypothetical protein